MGARRKRQSRTHESWWTESTGGMVHWLLVAVVAIVLVGGAGVSVYALNRTGDAQAVATAPRPVPSFTFAAPGPSVPTVAFLGDSFVVGTGAPTGQGYVFEVDETINARPDAFGEVGTGFVSPGTGAPYPERIAAVLASQPDYLIIQGSINDTGTPTAEVVAAASAVLDEVAAAAPDLPVALVGPIWLSSENQPDVLRLRAALQQLASDRGVTYIDPTGWIDDATAPALISDDGVHPNADGYDLIADRMGEAIVTVWPALGR